MKKLKKFVEFANIEDGCTRWLDHFYHFEKTGEYVLCDKKEIKKCPIDKENKN